MMEEEKLTSIGELIEPEPIVFGFGAPGWYILLGVFVLAILVHLLIAYRTYRKNKYRRVALQILETIRRADFPPHHYLFRIAELLKRVSITAYGRRELAPLNGTDWLGFLENRNRGASYFTPLFLDLLTTGLYLGEKLSLSDQDVETLYRESMHWIKKHRV